MPHSNPIASGFLDGLSTAPCGHGSVGLCCFNGNQCDTDVDTGKPAKLRTRCFRFAMKPRSIIESGYYRHGRESAEACRPPDLPVYRQDFP
jgi:hypothetical protein